MTLELEEVRGRIHEAIRSIDHTEYLDFLEELGPRVPGWLKTHLEMEHTVPSPSNVMRCRLQLWLLGQGYEPDDEPPILWKIAQIQGIIAEPVWIAILDRAGFGISLANERLDCGPTMWAHPDAVLDDKYILEFKRPSGIGFRKLLEASMGIAGAEYDWYVQMQLYMLATDKERGLFLASPGDGSLLQMMMRQRKMYGWGFELDPIYLEWVERDENTIRIALERAEMIKWDLEKDKPPVREFLGQAFDLKGRRKRPCGYCPFPERCNTMYGYGEGLEWER
jgi:hypothetical protein